MKANEELETYKRVLIVHSGDCDTADATCRQIYAQLVDSRHARCRHLQHHTIGIIVVLAAMNVFLCALIWFDLAGM